MIIFFNTQSTFAQPYYNEVYRKDNETKLIELENQYNLRERKQEITLLKQEQQVAEFRNQVYLIALGLAGLVIGLVTLLGLRLRRANIRLAHLLTEVQQLNKTREHFIGIIAHDMRKPLIAYRGLADLVSDRLRNKAYNDIRDISKSIDSTSVQIESMLDNLLRWALAQRETIPYQPESVRLSRLLHRVTDLYQNLVQFQDIRIIVDCPDTLLVWADNNGLQLIVRNLLDNALKHLEPNGEVRITAKITPKEQVKIQIEDTGEGLDLNQLTFLRRLFAGQVRGQAGQNGLGLGLLLVRDFVDRNHGRIEVVSRPEQGSCFSIYMPLSTKRLASTKLDKMCLN